jgi:predicted  nucleic acid-binding Zn-ribbon protein
MTRLGVIYESRAPESQHNDLFIRLKESCLLTPRFGLLSKKSEGVLFKRSDTRTDTSPKTIPISEALALVREIENGKVGDLCSDLIPLREAVVKSLKTIEKITVNLERDRIKVEEAKFESIVENSKSTVIASLRRELSVDVPLPTSFDEAVKFKDRLGSLTSRLMEVSESHKRVFNVFIKKYSGKLADEFERLSSLSRNVDSVMSLFDRDRKSLLECTDHIGLLSSKITSLKDAEKRTEDTRNELIKLEKELQESSNRIRSYEASSEFREATRINEEIIQLEQEQSEAQKQMHDLFSPTTRAFTKYSYGVTKEIVGRLKVLAEQPWHIFTESELTPYFDILREIRKALIEGKIVLKDGSKTVRHIDDLIQNLPSIKNEFLNRQHYLSALYQRRDGDFVRNSLGLSDEKKSITKRLVDEKSALNRLEDQLEENKRQVNDLRNKSESYLFKITGKNFQLLW